MWFTLIETNAAVGSFFVRNCLLELSLKPGMVLFYFRLFEKLRIVRRAICSREIQPSLFLHLALFGKICHIFAIAFQLY